MKQRTKQVIISVVKKKEIRWLNFFPVEMSLAFIMTIARGESTFYEHFTPNSVSLEFSSFAEAK